MNRKLILVKLLEGKFYWELDGWQVARHCPEYMDSEKYNWERDSEYVAQYCPEKLDPKRYNWEKSKKVAQFCPELFMTKYLWNLRNVVGGMWLDLEVIQKLILEV